METSYTVLPFSIGFALYADDRVLFSGFSKQIIQDFIEEHSVSPVNWNTNPEPKPNATND